MPPNNQKAARGKSASYLLGYTVKKLDLVLSNKVLLPQVMAPGTVGFTPGEETPSAATQDPPDGPVAGAAPAPDATRVAEGAEQPTVAAGPPGRSTATPESVDLRSIVSALVDEEARTSA